MKIKTFKLGLFAAAAFMAVTFISCSTPEEVEQATLISKLTMSNEDSTNGYPRFTGDAHGGKYFSHTDKGLQYGNGVVYNVPDSLIQKDIRIKVNMWVKQGDANPKNQFSFAVQAPTGEMLNWSEIRTQKYINETNKWININDSVTIPGTAVNKAGLIIKMFSFNPEGTSYMDVDDAEMSVYKVEKKLVD